MKYIWINPVVMEMYNKQEIDLKNYLEAIGYETLEGNSKLLDEVRHQFSEAVKEKKGIVLDTRCPLAIEKIKEHQLEMDYYVPEVYPILIQTAFYLYEKHIEGHAEHELSIMCPCRALAHLGNNLASKKGKERIVFYAWNEWAAAHFISNARRIDFTPIPLGFFKDTGLEVRELTGEEEILSGVSSLRKSSSKQVQIIEMLYCKGGCHNGDGV